jgi:tetratricopeptide (TPR) repeat protein
MAEAIGDLPAVSMALGNKGIVHENLGQRGAAEECYRRKLAIADGLGGKYDRLSASYKLGAFCLQSGDRTAAETLLSLAAGLAREIGNSQYLIEALCQLTELRLAQGDRAAAGELCEEAVRQAETSNELDRVAPCRILQARIAALTDPAAGMAVLTEIAAAGHDIGITAEALFHLQVLSGDAVDKGRALEAYRRIAETTPRHQVLERIDQLAGTA